VKRSSLSIILLGLVLCLSVAYLGSQVWRAYAGAKASEAVFDKLYRGSGGYMPNPKTIDGHIAEIRAVYEKYGDERLKFPLMDQLWYQSWFYPERSTAPLQEVIRLGRELYAEREDLRGDLAYVLVFAFLLADLPAEQQRWHGEALAQSPYMRESLNYLLISSRVLADDLPGARRILEDELARHPEDENVRLLALAGYMAVNDLPSAAKYAPKESNPRIDDINVRLAYANYLIAQEDFHSAIQQIRESLGRTGSDAEISQQLAAALIGSYGPEDEKGREALKIASTSTRLPRSADGALALAYGQLYALTYKARWLVDLATLADQKRDDFMVQASMAAACLDASDGPTLKQAEPVDVATTAQYKDRALHFAQAARRLAESPGEQQWAEILLARAQLRAAGTDAAAAPHYQAALEHLALALGDPSATGAIQSDRVPEYDSFLLDRKVQQIREMDEDFDQQVATLVQQYLERRKALFAEALSASSDKR